ncbi:MAG: tRNA (adenosine(37)-N6)-threonylcarbamoyltransferase complex ATPase subunit type 1 TsaE [Cytophagales bacterium]|nr:MAG: tRNA (adenosine(37)-N6)-threonylcarbamoyltransferase complex ATPase subunit type 1 TsaE [Cytophagales bacterium]
MTNKSFIFNLYEINSIVRFLILNYSDYKIWLFNGSMGVGKTTFIKELCKELNVISLVNSPTFSVVNEYISLDNIVIYHFDFYRIKHESEALDLGFDEYLDSGNYCFIEWSSMVSSLLPHKVLKLNFEVLDNLSRKLNIVIS